MEIAELVAECIKAMVDFPEDVVVLEIAGSHAVVMEVQVNRKDIGKVIGRRGANANALRHIINAWGGKARKRYIMEVIED